MKGLFCDDYRFPLEVDWIQFDYSDCEWQIVRNYNDFVEAINQEKFDIISFDHDLDRTSTFECVRCNTHQSDFDYSKVVEKTGRDCAEYLKEFCQKNNREIHHYLVHSLNEKGRKNIINILGEEKLVATYNKELCFDKADEILARRKKNVK
jgi:hypothetical protein